MYSDSYKRDFHTPRTGSVHVCDVGHNYAHSVQCPLSLSEEDNTGCEKN